MITQHKYIAWMLAFGLLLSACSNSPDNAASSQAGDSDKQATYVSEMDKDIVMSISITADPEEWQSMLDNASEKAYISADVTINGTTITNVGIKPKGNSSLQAVVGDDTTDRYSFKIKFDEYVDGQTWLGLDKLALNNNYSDASSMKEYLSYDILSEVGVKTPLFSYADISVNGETWGLYLAVEEPDTSYLERTTGGEGELYKPDSLEMDGQQGMRPGMNAGGQGGIAPSQGDNAGAASTSGDLAQGDFSGGGTGRQHAQVALGDMMPPSSENTEDFAAGGFGGGAGGGMQADHAVSLIYIDDNIESYASIFDNAETKADEADYKRVIEAIKNLNAGTDLEKYVDVYSVLRYLAGHTAVVNLDSYSSNMGHNYYLYENDGQINILPWDYNMAFGGFQSGSASAVVNFPIDTPVSGVGIEERPLISQLLAVPEYLEQYHEYLSQLVEGYFSDGKFAQRVDEIDAMISEYVKNDPTAFYTYEEYQTAIIELKKLGALRGESIRGQLDGTVPSTTDAQSANSSTLVDASAVNLSALGGSSNGGGQGQMPGGGNGGSQMFGVLDRETMQKALEILQSAQSSVLSEAQKAKLSELGLTEEQITQMLQMGQRRIS